jgi:Bacterial Ig-like domain (group 2)
MFVIKVLGVVRRKPILGMGCLFAAIATSLSCGGSSPAAQVVPPVNKTVTALAINPTNPSVQVGSTVSFKATASYSDGSTPSDVTSSASWSSSNPSVASIQATGTGAGVATGVAGGSADIMASFGGITSDTTLAVTGGAATATGLALSVINPSIAPGAKLQVVAVMEYSDGSNQKVTDSASWNSSNPAVATVDSSPGVVTGVTLGTTTISASVTGFPPVQTNLTVAIDAALVPLMDMTSSSQNYLGFEGGLYENSSDTPPSDHHDPDGKKAAAAIKPLDQNGNASSSGAIVFLGIGMSNATLEFSAFVSATTSSQSVNHSTLAVLDGAYGSVTACPWTVATGPPNCPEYTSGVPSENQYDRVRDTVLATAKTTPSAPPGCGTTANPCFTEKQVQVLWIKNANPSPALHGFASLQPFTDNCASEMGTIEACNYEEQLGETIRAAKARYPNLQQVFISTRIYAGYASVPLNPEPYAYEYGFSAKWLIQAQVNQIRNGTVDTVAGDMNYNSGMAAWTAWGPYFWAYGTTPRSDQLIWCNGQSGSPCNGEDDFQSDGTHPNTSSGVPKVVNLMMKFFSTSPYTPSWFCASKSSC